MKQKKNFDLKNYNSYNIESKCKLAYFPENEDDIIKLYSVKQYQTFWIFIKFLERLERPFHFITLLKKLMFLKIKI